MRKHRSKKWAAAKIMPPLPHSVPGQEYDVAQSEVAKWLIRQPDIMQLVFQSVKDGVEITYDPETGMWRGVDYAN